MSTPPFHLALIVNDLGAAEAFYAGTLGAELIAKDTCWLVFDLFGHKLTVNLARENGAAPSDDIALRHFGVILEEADFHELNARLVRDKARIVTPAQLHEEASVRARWVLFAKDPSGNGLEFNAFPGGGWKMQWA
jgi:extradiol dioxygenase family protein